MTSIELRSADLDQLEAGQLRAVFSARGDRILRYSIDVRHKGLNVHRELSAPEIFILEAKVNALLANWEEKYSRVKLANIFRDGKSAAEDATVQAHQRLESLNRILAHTLKVNDAVNWDDLKDHSEFNRASSFPEPKPIYNAEPTPVYVAPKIRFIDLILGRKGRLLAEAEAAYQTRRARWQAEDDAGQADLELRLKAWKRAEHAFWQAQEQSKLEFERTQHDHNAVIDQLAESVAGGDPTAVIEHATLVLENSDYDGLFEKSFSIQYEPNQKLLKVEYRLPTQAELPCVKGVKFNKITGEFPETRISEREARSNFENVSYQITLRTLHELFEADVSENVESILFNGVVEFVDPRTGQEQAACILSVLTSRTQFERIDLARVEPKACFKSLKGVSAASLGSLTAIPPVMEMDRTDERFVDGREIAQSIDQTQNLASMSWEDFEHLVRELFEKEFASRGGEVRITQASRDGGVDAIAFDPDPITGGKIVIQAKRYTRTVGVSAVRDLYGTVLNEGASKGILVTTADYGPDAHQFAQGKPLTLLSGSHLLYMLERHGYAAKIDLREAREIAQQSR